MTGKYIPMPPSLGGEYVAIAKELMATGKKMKNIYP